MLCRHVENEKQRFPSQTSSTVRRALVLPRNVRALVYIAHGVYAIRVPSIRIHRKNDASSPHISVPFHSRSQRVINNKKNKKKKPTTEKRRNANMSAFTVAAPAAVSKLSHASSCGLSASRRTSSAPACRRRTVAPRAAAAADEGETRNTDPVSYTHLTLPTIPLV